RSSRAYSGEVESARAANSVVPSPLWGGIGGLRPPFLAAKNADASRRLWRSAGVGVVRRSADGPPPPTPPHKGEGRAPSARRVCGRTNEMLYGAVPVGRCNAVFVRCRITHFERPAQPSATVRSTGGHVVGRPRR